MNDQHPPTDQPNDALGQQPTGEPPHEIVPPIPADEGLQPPQPTPPVYAPPPTQAPPLFGSQPPQYAPPPQQNQPWAQGQPQGFQPPQQFGQPQAAQPPQQFQQPQANQAPQQFAANGQPPQQPGQYAQQPYATSQPAQPTQPGQPYAQPQQYAPGQQPQPGQQYVPGGQPAAVAPRKGLPVGAWIGIGAGALMLLLVIVLGISAVAGMMQPKISDPQPAPTVEAPTEEPVDPEPLDVVTLDDTADFSAGPYWGVPFEDGWDIVRFDVEGVNEFNNAAIGCQFLTYQGYGPEGLTSTDDRGATEETISTALQIGIPWTAATASPEVNPDGSVELPVDYAYSVEMQRYVALYPTASGDRQRQMLLRSFMPNNLALYAEVDCPATPEGDKAAQTILDGLTITEF